MSLRQLGHANVIVCFIIMSCLIWVIIFETSLLLVSSSDCYLDLFLILRRVFVKLNKNENKYWDGNAVYYNVLEIKSGKEGRAIFENVSGLSGLLVQAQTPISLLLLLSLPSPLSLIIITSIDIDFFGKQTMSQAKCHKPFHFFDYLNFFGFYHMITFITW